MLFSRRREDDWSPVSKKKKKNRKDLQTDSGENIDVFYLPFSPDICSKVGSMDTEVEAWILGSKAREGRGGTLIHKFSA